MSSKTTVITGGGSGLGLVTARRLVEAGYSVVLVGRDATRTRAAAESLRGWAPPDGAAAPPRTYTADLEQWSQVRALAAELAADSPVDILINNAGAAFPRYEQTADGVERTYALNHHAPFLLTHALLAEGALTPQARIINMSSFVEKRGKLATASPAPHPSGGFFSESQPDTLSRLALNDTLARSVYTRTAALLGVVPLTR